MGLISPWLLRRLRDCNQGDEDAMKTSEIIAVFILMIACLFTGYHTGKLECKKEAPHIEGQNGRATK